LDNEVRPIIKTSTITVKCKHMSIDKMVNNVLMECDIKLQVKQMCTLQNYYKLNIL